MTGKISTQIKPFPGAGETAIYFVFEEILKKDKNLSLLNKKSGNRLQRKIDRLNFKAQEDKTLEFELGKTTYFIVGAGRKNDFNLAKFKKTLTHVLKKIGSLGIDSVDVFYFPELGKDHYEIAKNTALGFCLGNYNFDKYKSVKDQKSSGGIKELVFHFDKNPPGDWEEGIAFGKAVAEGIYLTRDLVNEPASHLHPETLAQKAFEIEKESGGAVTVEVLDRDECRRLGMGAFLGIAQGSDREPKFIILKYQKSNIKNQNDNSKLKKICLVGKSITFDSGGLSLKPSSAMENMKIDMAGGATVLGVFKILANMHRINVGAQHAAPAPTIYGILPACENMPSGKSIRPGDIVRAMNGKTIEVLNTDAEGRVTLADALIYAEKNLKADIIIDLATLTGACMVALGTDLTGLFGNDKKLIDTFGKIAEAEGDELWPLPLYKPYAKEIKSEVAELKNVSGIHYGGAITAALFLEQFVEKTPWLHLDIAGPAYVKGSTGWGVAGLIEFIKNYS